MQGAYLESHDPRVVLPNMSIEGGASADAPADEEVDPSAEAPVPAGAVDAP